MKTPSQGVEPRAIDPLCTALAMPLGRRRLWGDVPNGDTNVNLNIQATIAGTKPGHAVPAQQVPCPAVCVGSSLRCIREPIALADPGPGASSDDTPVMETNLGNLLETQCVLGRTFPPREALAGLTQAVLFPPPGVSNGRFVSPI